MKKTNSDGLMGEVSSSSSASDCLRLILQQQAMLGVHTLGMVSWYLIVASGVRTPSVVTHDCLTELCLESRELFVVFVWSPFLSMVTSLADRLIREKLPLSAETAAGR